MLTTSFNNIKYNKVHRKKLKMSLRKTPVLFTNPGYYFIAVKTALCLDTKCLVLIYSNLLSWLSKKGKMSILTTAQIPITKKKEKSRMGSGAGPLFQHVIYFEPGQKIFKIEGISKFTAADIQQKLLRTYYNQFRLIKK